MQPAYQHEDCVWKHASLAPITSLVVSRPWTYRLCWPSGQAPRPVNCETSHLRPAKWPSRPAQNAAEHWLRDPCTGTTKYNLFSDLRRFDDRRRQNWWYMVALNRRPGVCRASTLALAFCLLCYASWDVFQWCRPVVIFSSVRLRLRQIWRSTNAVAS